MKKGILLILFVLPLVLWAAPAKHKVSTVTYFPVPYVAYNRLNAKQQMDIGLNSNMCRLDLGCDALGNRPLATSNTVVQKGTLAINTKTNGVINNRGEVVLGQGTSTFASDGDERGFAELEFDAVRIRHVENPQGSLNVKELKVENLNLFGKPFPSCKDEGVADGQMMWMDLPLNYDDPSEVKPYLVCGAPCPTEHKPDNTTGACTIEDLRTMVGGLSEDQLAAMTTYNGRSYSELFTAGSEPGSWTVNPNVGACGTKTVTYACNPSVTPFTSSNNWGWFATSAEVSNCIPFKQTYTSTYDCSDWGRVGLPNPDPERGLGTYSGSATFTQTVTCQNGHLSFPSTGTWDYSNCRKWTWRLATAEEVSARYDGIRFTNPYYRHHNGMDARTGVIRGYIDHYPNQWVTQARGFSASQSSGACNHQQHPDPTCVTYPLSTMCSPDHADQRAEVYREISTGNICCAVGTWNNLICTIPSYNCETTDYICDSSPVE